MSVTEIKLLLLMVQITFTVLMILFFCARRLDFGAVMMVLSLFTGIINVSIH